MEILPLCSLPSPTVVKEATGKIQGPLLVMNHLPFVRHNASIVLLELQLDWVIGIFEIKKIQYFFANHDTYLEKKGNKKYT